MSLGVGKTDGRCRPQGQLTGTMQWVAVRRPNFVRVVTRFTIVVVVVVVVVDLVGSSVDRNWCASQRRCGPAAETPSRCSISVFIISRPTHVQYTDLTHTHTLDTS